MTPEAEKAIEDVGYTPGIMDARVSGDSILITPSWAPCFITTVTEIRHAGINAKSTSISESVVNNKETARNFANVRRIIDCWNSCVGMTNEELDSLRTINEKKKSDSEIVKTAIRLVKARMFVSGVYIGAIDGDSESAELNEKSAFRDLARAIGKIADDTAA